MRAMLRTLRMALVTNPLAVFCIVMTGVGSAVGRILDGSGDLSHRIVSFWARTILLTSGVRLDVKGKAQVPRAGGVLLVSNHLSMMDIPVLMACLPVSFRFVAKESLFRTPFIGWHLHCGRHISLHREDKRSAVKALGEVRHKLNEGTSVLIFAEGSRSESGLGTFKAGAAHLAIRTGAAVVPIGIVGTDKVLPKGSIQIRPEPIAVRIGEPLRPEGATREDAERFTEQLRERVSALISESQSADG